jgi:acetyl esterase/lipase
MPSEQLAPLVEQLRHHPLLEQIRTAPIPMTEARQGFDDFEHMYPLPDDVTVETVSANGVPAQWISTPGVTTDSAVLFFHGGGFVIGSAASHRELCSRIARASGAPVLVIDYRRAPEHRYPAALEDAICAYRWLLDQRISPSRIVVMGDSAGGGLTVSTLVSLRESKLPLPAAGAGLSAWVDLECTGAEPKVPDQLITRHGLREMGRNYLGETSARTPMASPLYADLHGLPPLYLQAGTAEVLLDDTHRLARHAERAGVDVTVDTWDQLFHVFQLYPVLPEADEAVDKLGAFARKHMH